MRRDPQAEALITVDEAARDRALIVGSVPPDARDVDLLVEPDDAAAIAGRLRDDGFERWGRTWVAFRGSGVAAVELIPASTLHLPAADLTALFADARPLDGLEHIVEPAPHHTLLILARKVARERRGLTPKHAARIRRALALDAAAWEGARARADGWEASEALAELESLYGGRDSGGRARPRRHLRLGPPRVLAIAGDDHEQTGRVADAVASMLDRLDVDVAVERVHGRPRPQTSLALWVPIGRRLGRGGVVVLARFLADGGSAAATRPPERSRASARFMRLLAPRPRRTYIVASPACGDGRGTNADRQARRAASPSTAAVRVDGRLSDDAICEFVAADAWRALNRQGALSAAAKRVAVALRERRRSRRRGTPSRSTR